MVPWQFPAINYHWPLHIRPPSSADWDNCVWLAHTREKVLIHFLRWLIRCEMHHFILSTQGSWLTAYFKKDFKQFCEAVAAVSFRSETWSWRRATMCVPFLCFRVTLWVRETTEFWFIESLLWTKCRWLTTAFSSGVKSQVCCRMELHNTEKAINNNH